MGINGNVSHSGKLHFDCQLADGRLTEELMGDVAVLSKCLQML